MIIIEYQKKNHKQIIHACIQALLDGKSVAYPTDTSYGLAVDATNSAAVKKLYQIKGRDFKKPVHVVIPSVNYGKKIVLWNAVAGRLAKKLWPGAITFVIPLKIKNSQFKILSAGTNTIGLRLPKNNIALDLSATLKKPITATSANVSGGPDGYSAEEIVKQYENRKYKPDIVINAGKLPRRKPSTLVKIDSTKIEILRQGPITEKQIMVCLRNKNSKS